MAGEVSLEEPEQGFNSCRRERQPAELGDSASNTSSWKKEEVWVAEA